MDVVETLADLLKQAGRPEIVSVDVDGQGILTAQLQDGAAIHVRVAYQGPASAGVPRGPSWPGAARATGSEQGGRR
jgi:hypothetical protein